MTNTIKLGEYPISLSSAGKEVIATHTVHTFTPEELDISLADLALQLRFLSDKGEQRIERKVVEEKILELKIFNFNNTLGTGLTEPIELGQVSGRKLYFVFTASSLSKKSIKRIEFTYFLGEEVSDE